MLFILDISHLGFSPATLFLDSDRDFISARDRSKAKLQQSVST